MKTFKRKRTLKELRAFCSKRGWMLNTQKFEEGSDYVSFKFKIGRVAGIALINIVNGQMFGHTITGIRFSSDSSEHDGKQWFKALLDAAYVS